jgi:hypothetical protein
MVSIFLNKCGAEEKKDLIKGTSTFTPIGLFLPTSSINNDKGSTLNLRKEIIGTDNMFIESSNYQLENRIEQAIPSHISTDRCVVM